MHVAIDAHLLGKGVGGVERVVRMLVERVPALLPEFRFTLLVNRRYEPDFAVPANARLLRLAVDDPLIQRSVILPFLLRRLAVDLLHVQRIAPFSPGCRVLAHIHDLLPLTEPQDHPGLRNAIVRRLTPGTVRRADHILTVSETVQAEIGRHFPAARAKTTAVYNGISAAQFSPADAGEPRAELHRRLGLAGDYVCYLGAITPRKNLTLVLRGWQAFRQANPASSLRLVLSGMNRSPEYGVRLRELARELHIEDSLVWTGFLTDAECGSLLRHALVFLAPSRGEGFDLPALEAMACGIPVLCSDIPVHRELLSACATFFDPDAAASLAAALGQSVQPDPDRALRVAAGRRRAAGFTWDRTADGVARLYRQLVGALQPLPARAGQPRVTASNRMDPASADFQP